MRDRLKILIADDDPAIRKVLTRILELNDYEVVAATDGTEAVELFESEEPNLMILDVRMPQADGITVCRTIRETSDIPIVILTSLEDESDAADALEAGADDYVRKPFGTNELIARLRALRRRIMRDRTEESERLEAGELVVDVGQHLVLFRGEEIRLSRTEFLLLVFLLRNPNRVLTHDQILERVWGQEYIGSHHALRVCISRLKQRFPTEALNIESLAGVGYRLRTR